MTNYDKIKEIGSGTLKDILTVAFLEGALSVVDMSGIDRVCKVSPSEYGGGDIAEFFDSDFAEMVKKLYEKYLNSELPEDGLHFPILKYICNGDV